MKMNPLDVSKANDLYDMGLVDELNEFIEPFLKNNDPYAYYFASKYSLVGWNESDDEFDKRRFSFLTKASEEGVAEAMYQLSSHYISGDIIPKDEIKGRDYLSKSAELGYGPAILSAGIYTFYGTNGYQMDIDNAIGLVESAAENGVEGAKDVLLRFKDEITK